MALWKDIGLTYTRYSSVAAAALRKCMKGAAGPGAVKVQHPIKVTLWEAGKPKKPE